MRRQVPGVLAVPMLMSAGGRARSWAGVRPQLIALDVDGTLVGPDGTVHDDVVRAIADATAAGLHVGLATGRMALGVTDLLARTGLPGPHVLHNGAEVRRGDEVLASWPVPTDALQRVLDTCHEQGIYMEVYVEDGFHVTVADERARPHWELLGHEPLSVVRDVADLGGSAVPKVTSAVFSDDERRSVIDLLEAAGLRAGPAGSPATPTMTYVNGTHPDADKGRALAAAAAALGIPMAATMAIGDAHNDLPLLAVAGTAIAMGDAHPDVIAAAHLVTGTVEAAGAATAIERATLGGFGAHEPDTPDTSEASETGQP